MEYLDDTVKTPEQVEQITSLPMLAGVGRIKTREGKLISIESPHSSISEAFRIIRLGIQYTQVDKPNRILLVTSPNPGDGKSLMTANLAVVLAQAGHKVLLIDADLRHPTQHKTFGLKNNYGLTSLLLQIDSTSTGDEQKNQALVEEMVQVTAESGLSILTSGLVPPNPSELLSSQKMKVALANLSQKYDYLIFDSSPVLAVTDPLILSTLVDGVVLLVNTKNTRKNELKQVVKRLRDVDSNLLGVVMNRLTQPRKAYYQYHNYQQVQSLSDPARNGTGSQSSSDDLEKSNGFFGKLGRKEQA